MNPFVRFFPVAASVHAAKVDWLIAGFTVLMVALTGPVFVLIIVYTLKYRRGSGADRNEGKPREILIETSWMVIPFLLTLGFFVYAAYLYLDLGRPPPDSLAIDVVAKQWMWKFEHPGGQREIDDLHVPVGQDVRLTMTSQDVIHSFFVPALRIKQDVLPGRYTELWFNADQPGVYDIRCSQFCGMDHSLMIGRVFVLSGGDYARWLQQSDASGDLASQGKALFQNLGCSGCHTPGSTVRAPPLTGLYNAPTPLQDGRVVTADAQYLRDSIIDPNRDIAAGYQPVMPTYAGQVSEDDLLKLVAYIKSLGPQRPAPPSPAPAEDQAKAQASLAAPVPPEARR